MEGRRTLRFTSLDEVMPEVDRLLRGHRTLGNWSLGQICNHLAGSFTMAVDGVPFKAPWLIRKTIGPRILAGTLESGRFPRWLKLPKKYEPKPGVEARAEAESLRATIAYFASFPGPLADHPLAGPIPRATWEQLFCIHCAHHLGFAVPDDGPAETGG